MGNSDDARSINKHLKTLEQNAYEIYREMLERKIPLTAQAFKDRLNGIKEEASVRMLITIFQEHNRQMEALIYHLKLRYFVVIELKTGKFIPEFAGKLNFYLNAVDRNSRHESDQPTIGILICKEKNKVVAKYSLKGIEKPIGISEYHLTKAIPKALSGQLPAIAEIEKNLRKLT